MNIFNRFIELFTPVKTLPDGVYHLQSPVNVDKPYRLHLRLHKDGTGILILNAATIIQLNPTAAEYAFHLIKGSTPDEAANATSTRYRIKKSQALQDYNEFVDKIMGLINRTDLDPVSVFGFEQAQPHSAVLAAPLRLDCALTYRLPSGSDPVNAPSKRVERELTTLEWQNVLDKAWAAGIPHIVFTGGEATLREDLPSLIAHAEKNGQVAGLLTDGNKLADKDYLDSLLQTGLDHLMIIAPLDGTINWHVLDHAVQADVFLTVHLTVTPQNLPKIQPLMTKLREAGVENLSISLSDPALHEEASPLTNHAAEIGFRMVSDLPVPYSDSNPVALEAADNAEPTGAGKTWMYIEPDGDVLPAQGLADQIKGNILKDSWEKIYTGA